MLIISALITCGMVTCVETISPPSDYQLRFIEDDSSIFIILSSGERVVDTIPYNEFQEGIGHILWEDNHE